MKILLFGIHFPKIEDMINIHIGCAENITPIIPSPILRALAAYGKIGAQLLIPIPEKKIHINIMIIA